MEAYTWAAKPSLGVSATLSPWSYQNTSPHRATYRDSPKEKPVPQRSFAKNLKSVLKDPHDGEVRPTGGQSGKRYFKDIIIWTSPTTPALLTFLHSSCWDRPGGYQGTRSKDKFSLSEISPRGGRPKLSLSVPRAPEGCIPTLETQVNQRHESSHRHLPHRASKTPAKPKGGTRP